MRQDGNVVDVLAQSLRSRHTTSCGCYAHEAHLKAAQALNARARPIKHGHSRRGRLVPEYEVWRAAIKRTTNSKHRSFKHYGGRGIGVCNRWRDGEDGLSGFSCFLSDMGQRPSPRHSLERIDNNGNYEPANCRWATRDEQNNNKRDNRAVLINGTLYPSIAVLERAYGFNRNILRRRINRGVPLEKLLAPRLAAAEPQSASARPSRPSHP